MTFVIYQITHKKSKRFYIGKTSETNWNSGYMGSGDLVKQAVARYGKSAFYRAILGTFTIEADAYADEAIRVTMDEVNDPQCYNLIVGGRGLGSGPKHPSYGCKKPELTARNKTWIGPNNPVFGMKRPEHAKKMKKNTGKLHHSYNPATGKSVLFGRTRPDHSLWVKQNQSGENHPRKGKTHSNNSKIKISLARLRKQQLEFLNPVKEF